MYTIITKDNCKWCVLAKKEFKKRNLSYNERNIPEDLSKEEFQHITEQHNAKLTVPKIFRDSVLIGGYEDLIEHFENEQGGYGEGKL
jgi:glutaredoxin|tara:strand:+ start:393 stop:653 length:261 start_codon:yes stop_codon:yes gene_type:complete